MLITIALMALGMLMLAVCPSYATIGGWAQVIVIAGRLVQGLALGGEVGPSTAYLLEAAPPDRRGFVTSWQIASQGCAALFAGLVATTLALTVGDSAMAEWGWRLMFALGLCVVPVGLVIRSHLPETAGAEEDPHAAASTLAVVGRLLREHGRLLGLTFLVIAASTVSNSVGTNMPVYAGATLGLSETASTAVPIALGLASVLFPLLGGWLADRVGRRPVMIWPRALILVLAVPAFAWVLHAPSAASVYAVTFLLSALSSINAAAVIVGIPEALPRAVRSAGLSIVYAVAVSVFGGSTNYLVNWLIAATGDRLAPAYYLAAFSLVGTVAALLLPETRGRDLDADTAA
jgi:MFS family permease